MLPQTGVQIQHEGEGNVNVTGIEHGAARIVWRLDSGRRWFVTLAPDDSGLGELGRALVIPPDYELPELIYVSGSGHAMRVLFPTQHRGEGNPTPWAEMVNDRDLEIMEALARLVLARIEGVRNARTGQ